MSRGHGTNRAKEIIIFSRGVETQIEMGVVVKQAKQKQQLAVL